MSSFGPLKVIPRRLLCVMGAIGALGAGVMLLLWAMGRLLSDAYLRSQWLAWLPTPAAIAAAALDLLCAARPSWRDPAP
ncbi:MAG: hypothetical protein ACYTGC_06695, partial [Planctomycetota bacterium]